VMELKVWVEGVVRVVCGLSLTTSCQDVVIALAKSLGRTGRYLLIVKLRGAERQLVAEDCPLQHLSQLGQLAPEFHFVLRRTGPSRGDGASSGPCPPAHLKRTWTPSPRASPEPRASPVSFPDPHSSTKEEVFRDAGPTVVREAELEDLERRLRQNEADLMLGLRWEEKFQAEVDREEDLQRGLQRLHALMEDHPHQLEELQAHSVQLEQEVQLEGHRLSSRADSRPPEEALRPLKQELRYRWQQGEDLEAAFSGTQRDLQAAEQKLQGRREMIEELNKELRQCKLQQFILQTGAPPPRDPRRPLPQQCWHHGAAEGLDVMKSSTAELK
uniref:Ras-associating domain-containing protein n=1 Tax=Gasterosteus aculeatus TaxID=69293 RepID=G3Q0A1_GASAC